MRGERWIVNLPDGKQIIYERADVSLEGRYADSDRA